MSKQSTATRFSDVEWIPFMLRKSRAIPLAIICWSFVVALEVFNQVVRQSQGLSTANVNGVRAARYLPTIGVVILSFVWKSVNHDVKKVLPFATMSGRFAPAADSILLDYVNCMEIQSAFTALRRRHWAVVFSLGAGFLFGALVSLSNSLTYTDLLARAERDEDFTLSSTFSFNNSLADNNGSLLLPWNYLGNRPFAVASSRILANGRPPPWTYDGYAFEKFTSSENRTTVSITADVKAFSATLDCLPLRYSWQTTDYGTFILDADGTDVGNAGCALPVQQKYTYSHAVYTSKAGKAWLNLTACSQDSDDLRILASLIIPTKFDNTSSWSEIESKGLICFPKYRMRTAHTTVDANTGEIIGFDKNLAADIDVDIRTRIEAIWIYLNNPLDSSTQRVFAQSGGGPNYNSSAKPNATFGAVIKATNGFVGNNGLTPFFTSLSEGYIDSSVQSWRQNTDKFQADVSNFGGNIIVQAVNAFARQNISKPIQGRLTIHEPRLLIRKWSLRGLQAISCFIGLLSILLMSILRPKTLLREDPGPLAHTAVLLATSDQLKENILGRAATSTVESSRRHLKNTEYMMQSKQTSGVSLHMRITPDTALLEQNDYAGSDNFYAYQKSPHSGWQPLSLLLWCRVIIIMAFLGVMIALAVLQWRSNAMQGLIESAASSSISPTGVVTVVLVILGYVASGVDGAVRELATSRGLSNASSRQPLLHNPKDILALWVIFQPAARHVGFAMIASSIVVLIFPTIKIVAAGLFIATASISTSPITAQVDNSLMSDFERVFDVVDTSSLMQRASQFVEWTQIPSMYVPQRAGILDNLVIGILESPRMEDLHIIASSYNHTARVPAISINVTCKVAGPNDFQYIATRYENDHQLLTGAAVGFGATCYTQKCKDVFGISDPLTKVSSYNLSDSANYTMVWDGGDLGGPWAYTGFASLSDMNPLNLEDYTSGSDFTTGHYFMTLNDYSSSLGKPINVTFSIPPSNTTLIKDPSMVTFPLPTLLAVSCDRTLSLVSVITTFNRPVVPDLNGVTYTLSWTPASYDATSIKYLSDYNKTLPAFLSPRPYPRDQFSSGRDQDGALSSQSLWPTHGSSTNVYQLLAAYAEFSAGNLSGLLTEHGLGEAAHAVYTAYIAQALTELRPYVKNHTDVMARLSNQDPATVGIVNATEATSTQTHFRIRQDWSTTLVLEILLAICLICVIWVFVRYPIKPIVPNPPDSLAARMAFLSGSELVDRLRRDDVRVTKGQDIWSEVVSLGWWPVHKNVGSEKVFHGWRWGIDLGMPEERRWDRYPGFGIGGGLTLALGAGKFKSRVESIDTEVEIELSEVTPQDSQVRLLSQSGLSVLD